MQNTLFSAVRPFSTSYSRAFKRTFILSLSGLCFYGFVWQSNRYSSSSKRWQKVQESLSSFAPAKIEGENAVNYPWSTGNVNDWEYKLVELKGYFKDERFFVRRTKDSRLGYLVFAPFVTAKKTLEAVKRENVVNGQVEHTIFVNLGWVPLEHKKDIEMGNEPIPMLKRDLDDLNPADSFTELRLYDESDENANPVTKLVGIVRKGEEQDILNKKRNWPYEGVYTFIDLPFMRRFFRVFNSSANDAYIERIVPSFTSEEEELYPVPASASSFDKPYLTPERHRGYAAFWFFSGIVGLAGALFV